MNCFLLWFVFLFVCSIDFVKGISEADFYPFGQQNGDSRAPTNDDGSTDPIPVSSLFPFFNHQHDSLIVNTNGVISFLGTMSTYTPSAFPLASYRRLIAPYWADVDTNNGGDIWFRETTNDTILQKASENIHNVFPEQFNFQASWVFVATWSDVAFYGADEIGKTKRCTFQCLLITNGRHSFTVFLYDKIEWTTGTASQGSSSTGLGGVPAQVGFDAGDGINFFALGASRTFDIINVTTMSNIDVPGKFIFRVDSSSIKQGGCNTNGTLTVTPREATMLGGTRLIISGPCFNITETVSLQMSDGSAVLCKLQTDISVTCISPQVFRTGKEVILLNIIHADSTRSFRGILTIVNHALTKSLLKRNPVSWKYGQAVDILWSPIQMAFQVDTLVSLDLYIPTVSNNTIGTLVYHSFITILNDVDVEFGIYSFLLDFNVESGILKLSSNDSQSPYYWTDMFTVNVNISDSQRICSDWIEQDQELQLITSDEVSPCPCSLDVVLIDTTRFHVDPMCVNTGASDLNCPYQPSAMACFKQNIPSLNGYDHQCCYDDSGVLMNPNGFDQSGFVNRYHYFGNGDNNIPFLSNFVFDTMPYQHCCVYPSEDFGTVDIHIYTLCSSFYERRPPQSCLNYVPPRTARVSGDPHFVTFDGFLYTFNPVGEFVGLVNTNFTLQLRMEQFGNSQGSAVTAFVAKPFQTADVVEVQPNTIRGIDVIVNGEVVDFDSLISRTLSFEGGTVERTYDERPTIIINFETEGFSIKTFTAVNILNLIILVSPDLKEGGFTGLFGNNDGVKENELVSRDGHLIDSSSSSTDIQNRFGLSWRTLENESLFTYSNGRSHDSYQDHNFNPVIDIPQNIDPVIISECRNNTECIYDYYVTGDQSLGQSSANASRDYDVISNLTVEVTTCGFPSNISNAVWIANGYTEGSSAFLTCGTEYYPVDAMSSCMTSGYWLDVNVTCIPLPNCGHPPRVANSSWLPDVESNGQTAILVCNDGFYKYDSVQVNCTTNNTWTSFAGGFCFEANKWTYLRGAEWDSCGFVLDIQFCTDKKCKEPPYAGGGQWSVEGYRKGSVAELTCNPEFTSSSTTITIQCNLNGQWEQANGSCTFETTTSVESSTEYIGSTVRDMSTSPKVSITVSSNPQTLSELRSTFSTTTESGTTSSTPTDKTNTFQTTTEDKNTSSNTTGERSTYQSTTESSTTLTTSNLTETYSRLETNTESSNNTFSTAIEQTNTHQTTTETTTNPTIGPSTSITSTEQTPREQFSTPLNTTISLTTSVPTTILSTNTGPETTVSTSTAQASSDITTREQTNTQLTTNETKPHFSATTVPSSTFSITLELNSTLSISANPTTAIAITTESSSTFSTSTEETGTTGSPRETKLTTNDSISEPTITFSTTQETSSSRSLSKEQTSYPRSSRNQTSIPLTTRENTNTVSTKTELTSAIATTPESSSTLSTSTEGTRTLLFTRDQTSPQLPTNETITYFSTSTVPTTTFSTASETSNFLSTSNEETRYPLSTRKQTIIPLTIRDNTTNVPTTTLATSAIETLTESSSTFSTSTKEAKTPLSTQEQTSTKLTTNETITSFSTSTSTVPTTSISAATETSSTLSTSKEQTSHPLSTRKQTSSSFTIKETMTNFPITTVPDRAIETPKESSSTFSTSTEETKSPLSTREQTSPELTTNETITSFSTSTVPTTMFSTATETSSSLSTSKEQTSYPLSTRKQTSIQLTTRENTTTLPTSIEQMSTKLTTAAFETTTVPTNSFAITKKSTNTLSTSVKQTSSSQSPAENITAVPPTTQSTTDSPTSTHPTSILSTSSGSTKTEQTNKLPISTESTNTLLASTKQSSTSQLTTERITKTTTTAVSTTSKEPKNIFSTTVEQSGTTVSSTEETVSILTTKDTNIRLQTTTEYISSPSTTTKTGLERSTQTSQKTTNPFSVNSEGNYASDNDTGNKLTFTITIVSSVVGVLIFITVISMLVTCVYRKKKYGTPSDMGMQRTKNMHSDSYSNVSNEFNGLHRNSGPPLYHRSWTFDPKSAFSSFENLSSLQKNQTDSTENIDNYHV